MAKLDFTRPWISRTDKGRFKKGKTILERFESQIYYSIDGCWYWTGSPNGSGYGSLEINYKSERAHRLSFKLFKGHIPEGLHVCHTCDNRICVNPDHLWLGTRQDNMDDMRRKGRFKPAPIKERKIILLNVKTNESLLFDSHLKACNYLKYNRGTFYAALREGWLLRRTYKAIPQ